MRLVSSAFTEEQGGGLSDMFRLHSLSGAAPRHRLGASSLWHPSLFSIYPKAKLFYQTLPKWLWPPPLFLLLAALAVLVYSAVPLPGRKESLSPQRLFNTRASFNFFQFNKYLLSICLVPQCLTLHWNQQLWDLLSAEKRKRVIDWTSVSPKNSYIEVVNPNVTVFEEVALDLDEVMMGSVPS